MPAARRSSMLIPLGIALLAHAAIGFWIRLDQHASPPRAPDLSIRLQPVDATVTEPSPSTTVPEPVQPPPESRARSILRSPEDQGLEEPEPHPPRTVFSPSIIDSAREHARARSREQPAPSRFRTFSTDDFPSRSVDPEPDPWVRSSGLTTFVRTAEVVEYRDARGDRVIRRVDGFGNVTCTKQIHIPGDGNGPLWYPMPRGGC